MREHDTGRTNRRTLLRRGAATSAMLVLGESGFFFGQSLEGLEVASAGSIRAMLDGPLKTATAEQLRLDLHSHSGGADAVARMIVEGSLAADVFLPITAGPMQAVQRAGRAATAYPFARTEMVLLYSPRSRFAAQFAEAAQGKRSWWEVLQEPGIKFARSNPEDDPSGRAIVFTMMLAATKYRQPDLVKTLLGPLLNPQQMDLGKNVRAGLESGAIDAAGSYRIATLDGKIPYVPLSPEINLSHERIREEHPELSFQIGNRTFYPEPLVFYAAALRGASNAAGAQAFVKWLQTKQAMALLHANGFEVPAGLAPLSVSTE